MPHLHKTRVLLGPVSSVALIAANLAPVGGVVFLPWFITAVLWRATCSLFMHW